MSDLEAIPPSPVGAPVHLDRIGQIAIPVGDVAQATAFYRDVLGMHHLFSAPPGLSFFDCGGIRLMLEASPTAASEERRSSILYYHVADLDESCAALQARGVVLEAAPHLVARMTDHDLWMAFIRDSESNIIGLMNERRP